jgi:serine/threonine protein kinase
MRLTHIYHRVADWKPSGRAADIFSLGCVLVEILCLHRRGSLDQIRKHRSLDPSFHANLDQLTIWLQKDDDKFLREEYYLEQEIGLMLSRDPARRPTATQLLRSITVHDIEKDETSTTYLFGPCCKGALITSAVHVAAIAELEERFRRSTEHIKRQYDEQQRRLTEIMEWKLEDCRKEYEYLAEKNFRKWKRTHEELAQRSNMQLMERKLEERKKEYEYVAEINFRKWKKSHEELAQRSSMQEKELIDTRVQLNALKRLSVTPASRPFSLFPFAQSQHLLASQDPSSFEDKRGQFAPQWPTRPRRIIEEHHGYDSYSDPESSRSSDRTADTGPEFSRGTLNGVDDPSALLRTPGVGRRRPVPTAPKIYNPVEDMMEQIPRQFGENDVSEDKKKPAKPSLRDRLGLLSRSRRN